MPLDNPRDLPIPGQVTCQLPRKLKFLLDMHPYKVAYGGRHGLKTRSFCVALITLGSAQRLKILCCREVMKSLKDSVHEELKMTIEAMGVSSLWRVTDKYIECKKTRTRIIFAGLSAMTAASVKSYAGIDILWVEEGQTVKKRSWEIILPTIRAENSEIWVSFNPDMDDDDTYVRFLVNTPPGTMLQKTGWQDAAALEMQYPGKGWFPNVQNEKRLHAQKTEPDEYDNIWEGAPRTVVAGAIFAKEIGKMVEEQRLRPTPYDPRFPVHCIWDLGWNDAMSIVMVQKTSPSTLNVINYLEVHQWTYAQCIGQLNQLGYMFGTDYMPHDAEQHDPKSGTNAKKLLTKLGRKVKIIPRSDPEARIKAARMMFPRVYMDTTERPFDHDNCYLGAARLAYCLKRYKRAIPEKTMEPGAPVHDAVSHAADAFGGLAEIVDQIRNDGDRPKVRPLAPFTNANRGMGTLG